MKGWLPPVLLLLAGCEHIDPYGAVGLGYRLDDNSDWYVRGEREWQCDGLTAHFEVGVEFDYQVTLGYHHQSHLICGSPFNNSPELYEDEIVITKKFGGRK